MYRKGLILIQALLSLLLPAAHAGDTLTDSPKQLTLSEPLGKDMGYLYAWYNDILDHVEGTCVMVWMRPHKGAFIFRWDYCTDASDTGASWDQGVLWLSGT